MRRTKYLFITLFLSCLVICLSAPSLWAGGACSATAPTDVLTHEQIRSEFDPMMLEHLLFSEIHMTTADFHFRNVAPQIGPRLLDGNFYMGDFPSQLTFGQGPATIGELPDTSKPAPEAETESNFESVVDHLQPFVLEGGPVKENRAVEEAFGKFKKAKDEANKKWAKALEAAREHGKAQDKLWRAVNDVMDAEPGEEAKKAAEKAKEATKEVDEAKKKHEKATEEAKKAQKKANKASREYNEAKEKAEGEAEKQNKAAQEAAEKAPKTTGDDKSNKR